MGITKKMNIQWSYSSGNIMEIYRIYSGIVVFEEYKRCRRCSGENCEFNRKLTYNGKCMF